MRSVGRRLFASLLVLCFCLAIACLVYVQAGPQTQAEIGPVTLEYSCEQAKTTSDFERYWSEFRTAVRSGNKESLFSMVNTCSFVWDNGTGSTLPLRSPEQIAAEFIGPYKAVGTPLVFETQDDFLQNYNVVFSPPIRDRLLRNAPVRLFEGVNEIRWRDKGLNSLRFDNVAGVGYKFSGLSWEP